MFRPEASLCYFNADYICELILERTRGEAVPPKLIVLDLSASPYMDLQSTQTLSNLAAELTTAGFRVQVVEARSSVRERLRSVGLDAKLGGVSRGVSVADAIAEFQRLATA